MFLLLGSISTKLTIRQFQVKYFIPYLNYTGDIMYALTMASFPRESWISILPLSINEWEQTPVYNTTKISLDRTAGHSDFDK